MKCGNLWWQFFWWSSPSSRASPHSSRRSTSWSGRLNISAYWGVDFVRWVVWFLILGAFGEIKLPWIPGPSCPCDTGCFQAWKEACQVNQICLKLWEREVELTSKSRKPPAFGIQGRRWWRRRETRPHAGEKSTQAPEKFQHFTGSHIWDKCHIWVKDEKIEKITLPTLMSSLFDRYVDPKGSWEI